MSNFFRGRSPVYIMLFLSIFLLHKLICFHSAAGIEILTHSKHISENETLTSNNQIFELGFFSPSNSQDRYIGIWYKNVSVHRVVWVANREKPLAVTDSFASLRISSDGNLRLVDGRQNVVWSTSVTTSSTALEAVLLDTGNFILRESVSGGILWESFNYLCDTFLPEMMIGLNTKTGERRYLESWKSENDPSSGTFLVGVTAEMPPQVFVWNGSSPYWRSGQWNGLKFIGIPELGAFYSNGFSLMQDNQQGTQYLNFKTRNNSFLFISSQGSLQRMHWFEQKKEWVVVWVAIKNSCDVYGACGPFGVCNNFKFPICRCLKEFVPKSSEEWNRGNWTGGCVRRVELSCKKNTKSVVSRRGVHDEFWRLSGTKLPDKSETWFVKDAKGCESWCLNNCSCEAYAYVTGIGCMAWAGNLIDIETLPFGGEDLFLRISNSELGNPTWHG